MKEIKFTKNESRFILGAVELCYKHMKFLTDEEANAFYDKVVDIKMKVEDFTEQEPITGETEPADFSGASDPYGTVDPEGR